MEQGQSDESVEKLVSKVNSLEKDLYYYRKSSRDMRKKLQGVAMSASGARQGGGDGVRLLEEEHTNSAPELEANEKSHKKARKRRKTPSGRGVATTAVGGAITAELEQVSSVFARSQRGERESAEQAQKLEHAGPSKSETRQTHPLEGGARDHQLVVKKHRRELRQLR